MSCPAGTTKATDGTCLKDCPLEWKTSNGGCLAPELQNGDRNAAADFLNEEEARKKYTNKFESDKCGDDILNMDCHQGLKILIWIIIACSAVFILFFIYYVIQAIALTSRGGKNDHVQQASNAVVPPQPVVQPIAQPIANPSFFGRLFGSDSLPQKREQKEAFFTRMFGKSA